MKKEFKTRSIKENLNSVLSFVNDCVSQLGLGVASEIKTKMACEKVFLIITDLLNEKISDVRIVFRGEEEKIFLEFYYDGSKFDPTSDIKKDFTVQNTEDNLEINFVNKIVDDLEYSYENEQNKLVIMKTLPQKKGLKIEQEERNEKVFLTLIGRVDTVTAPALDEKFSELFKNGKKYVYIDLDSINFVSSAGLRSFLMAQKSINKLGGEMKINNVSETIYSVFALTGFADVIDISKK